MRSEKQKAASRANGAKSRGAVTPEGKARSRAGRRGIDLSESVLLEGESLRLFLQFLREVEQELLPETPLERAIVEKMVVFHWRQMRIWGFERCNLSRPNAFANASCTNESELHATYAFLNPTASTALIQQYEAECNRQFFLNLGKFFQYRGLRKRFQPPSEAQNGTLPGTYPDKLLIPVELGLDDPPTANPKPSGNRPGVTPSASQGPPE